jgi:hypothetical protein
MQVSPSEQVEAIEAQAVPYSSGQCGVNALPQQNIVNGTNTVAGELPWMVRF